MERSASHSGRFSLGTRAPVSTEPTWWGWREIFLPFPRFEHAPKLTAQSIFRGTLSVAQIITVSNRGKHKEGSGSATVRADATTTTDLTQKRVSNPGHEHEETPGTRPLRSAGPCSQRMHACSNRAFRSTNTNRVYPKGTDKFQKPVPHTKTSHVNKCLQTVFEVQPNNALNLNPSYFCLWEHKNL